MAALFGHGLLERGGGPTSASLAIAEVLSGERTAAVMRVAGFVTTRPGRMRLVSAPGAFLDVLPIGERPVEWHAHGVGRADARRTVIETRRVGLWDTVFAAEGSFVDLGGGGVMKTKSGGYQIENRTPHTLRNTALCGYGGPRSELQMWSVGTVPPGARRVVEASRDPGTLADLELPEIFLRSANLGLRTDAVSLLTTLDEPLLPAFEGFARDGEPTMLRVVMP